MDLNRTVASVTVTAAEKEAYHDGFEMPLLRSGLGERRSMETASETLDQAVFAAYRRQQELVWTEHQVEHIEQAVGSAGITLPPGPPPAMSFVDLTGYTRLTEERGDEEAAAMAARFADIVRGSPQRHRGEAVKWVGDGVMIRFRDPAGASCRRSTSCATCRRPVSHLRTSGWPPDP
jgi:class 3 adenylate cyclase